MKKREFNMLNSVNDWAYDVNEYYAYMWGISVGLSDFKSQVEIGKYLQLPAFGQSI